MYAEGRGVPQDDAEAARWYLGAAEGHRRPGGAPQVQVKLGEIYNFGRGVTQDYVEAARWYRLAAAKGHPAAQFNLGLMYDDGRGVPQDDVSAHMWLNLATAQSTGEERERRATPWPSG